MGLAYRHGWCLGTCAVLITMSGRMELPSSPGSSGLRVASLLKVAGSTSLAHRVQAADTNRDGELSHDEVLQVLANELAARRSAKRMGWALLAALAVLVVVLAANAFLTFAVVKLSKDTQVKKNVLVAKDSGRAIQTGLALEPRGLGDMLWLNPANGTLYAIHLPLPDGQPGFVWHQVAGVEVHRGKRTTIYTIAGPVLTVTPQCITLNSTGLPGRASELEAPAPAAGPGRRLSGTEEWEIPWPPGYVLR